jgi:hypothetical protein
MKAEKINHHQNEIENRCLNPDACLPCMPPTCRYVATTIAESFSEKDLVELRSANVL